MEKLFDKEEGKKGINWSYLLGGAIGLIVIAALVYAAMQLQGKSMDDQKQAILADALHDDSPQFQDITKDIIISTGDNTVESPNAFGTISMFISGKVRNKGTRNINGLEVNVAVVDQFNQVLKEKRVLVVPTQVPILGPNDVIPITLAIDGFNKKDDRANIRWRVTAIRLAQ